MDHGSSTLASISYALDPAGLIASEAQTGLPVMQLNSLAVTAGTGFSTGYAKTHPFGSASGSGPGCGCKS